MLSHCEITPIGTRFLVDVKYRMHGTDIQSAITFETINQANAHIRALQLELLRYRITKFVRHKEQIMQRSKFKPRVMNMKGLGHCTDFVKYIKDEPRLYEAVKFFLVNKQHFESIMPHRLNLSYESSIAELEAITDFCTQYFNEHKNKAHEKTTN